MTVIFASAFLAGALLSCLLPIALLLSLAWWYFRSVRRVPPTPADAVQAGGRGAAPEDSSGTAGGPVANGH
jgi:hypothetical protein